VVVRPVDIEPSVGQGFEIAREKGLEAVACGAELRLPQRRSSRRRLRAAARPGGGSLPSRRPLIFRH